MTTGSLAAGYDVEKQKTIITLNNVKDRGRITKSPPSLKLWGTPFALHFSLWRVASPFAGGYGGQVPPVVRNARRVVGDTELESVTSCVSSKRSNQLS